MESNWHMGLFCDFADVGQGEVQITQRTQRHRGTEEEALGIDWR
jgi:hypothetical protein